MTDVKTHVEDCVKTKHCLMAISGESELAQCPQSFLQLCNVHPV